jgi:hypothetical protein
MRLTDHLVEEGSITDKEFEALTHKTDEMLIKLHGHPLTEKLPQKVIRVVKTVVKWWCFVVVE